MPGKRPKKDVRKEGTKYPRMKPEKTEGEIPVSQYPHSGKFHKVEFPHEDLLEFADAIPVVDIPLAEAISHPPEPDIRFSRLRIPKKETEILLRSERETQEKADIGEFGGIQKQIRAALMDAFRTSLNKEILNRLTERVNQSFESLDAETRKKLSSLSKQKKQEYVSEYDLLSLIRDKRIQIDNKTEEQLRENPLFNNLSDTGKLRILFAIREIREKGEFERDSIINFNRLRKIVRLLEGETYFNYTLKDDTLYRRRVTAKLTENGVEYFYEKTLSEIENEQELPPFVTKTIDGKQRRFFRDINGLERPEDVMGHYDEKGHFYSFSPAVREMEYAKRFIPAIEENFFNFKNLILAILRGEKSVEMHEGFEGIFSKTYGEKSFEDIQKRREHTIRKRVLEDPRFSDKGIRELLIGEEENKIRYAVRKEFVKNYIAPQLGKRDVDPLSPAVKLILDKNPEFNRALEEETNNRIIVERQRILQEVNRDFDKKKNRIILEEIQDRLATVMASALAKSVIISIIRDKIRKEYFFPIPKKPISVQPWIGNWDRF